jgi:hypothetical protein
MMKNLTVAAIVLMMLFSGCYYEDGPIVSLRSPKARLVNKWRYQKFLVNGQDITDTYTSNGAWVEFKTDNSAEFHESSSYTYYAIWELDDDYKTLYLDCSDTSGLMWSQDYEILKLRNKEIWMTSDMGSASMRVELIEY